MATTVLGRLYRSIRMAAAHTTLHLLVTTARLQKITIWHLPEKHLCQAIHASFAFSFSEYYEEVFLVQLFVEIALGKGRVCQDAIVECRKGKRFLGHSVAFEPQRFRLDSRLFKLCNL